jgi:hypothetical protein
VVLAKVPIRSPTLVLQLSYNVSTGTVNAYYAMGDRESLLGITGGYPGAAAGANPNVDEDYDGDYWPRRRGYHGHGGDPRERERVRRERERDDYDDYYDNDDRRPPPPPTRDGRRSDYYDNNGRRHSPPPPPRDGRRHSPPPRDGRRDGGGRRSPPPRDGRRSPPPRHSGSGNGPRRDSHLILSNVAIIMIVILLVIARHHQIPIIQVLLIHHNHHHVQHSQDHGRTMNEKDWNGNDKDVSVANVVNPNHHLHHDVLVMMIVNMRMIERAIQHQQQHQHQHQHLQIPTILVLHIHHHHERSNAVVDMIVMKVMMKMDALHRHQVLYCILFISPSLFDLLCFACFFVCGQVWVVSVDFRDLVCH